MQDTGSRARRLQPLWPVGSIVAAPRLQSAGPVVVAPGLRYSEACGVFLDQGSNLLHWQVNSSLLSHEGSRVSLFLAQNLVCYFYPKTRLKFFFLFLYFGITLDKFRLGESHFLYCSLLEFLRYLLTILPSKSLFFFFF